MKSASTPLLVLALAAVPGLAAPLAAQCSDPQPDGQVLESLDLDVTFSDGYVTRMDVRAPAVPPGPCGWPTLLIIHSNRGSKQAVADEAERYARRGYVTVTFDFRGQGPSMALNNPNQYGRGSLGIRERLDVFEILEAAEAQFPPLIDFQRLGVTGPTQGGLFAWCAAAHSGRVPPANPWRSAPFPEIAAVAVHDFDVDLWQWLLPDGTNASEMFLYNVFGDEPGLNVDPAYKAFVEPYVLAEDWAGLRTALDRPQENLPSLLATSSVPALVTQSYDDMFGAANGTYGAWQNLLAGAPKVLNLTTGGHRSPANARERALREHRESLWFDHHLRGIQNGADQLEEYRLAIRPAETARCLDEDYLWDAAVLEDHPQSIATPLRLYLGGGGTLVGSPAQAGGGQDTFVSDNLTGYDIADYMADLPSAEQLMQDIPLQGLEYRSQPFAEDLFVVGAPQARIQARSQDAEFLVHVALLDERPSGLTRYVAGGFRTVRGHGGGTVDLDVPIAVYGYCLKKGHRLVVRVENLAWHRPPMKSENGPSTMPSFLRALPVFDDFTVRVRRDGPGSWVELPVATLDEVRVGSALPKLLGGAPEDLRSVVVSDSRYAGWDFQMLAGFSGSSPGVVWHGTPIPVNVDGLTARVLGLGPFTPLPLMQGTLDSEGRGEAFLALGSVPFLPSAAQGLTLTAVLVDGQGGIAVSDALTLPID